MSEITTAPPSVMEHLQKIKSGDINNTAPLQGGDEGMVEVQIPPTQEEAVGQPPVETEKEQPQAKQEEVKEPVASETKVSETKTETEEAKPAESKSSDFFDLDEAPASEEGKLTPTDLDKVKAWDAITKDPEFDLFLKAKQAGKSLADLTKEYQKVDYTKMDADAIMNHYGQLKGYDSTKIEQSLEWIASLPPIQQDRELAIMANELEQIQSAKFKDLGLRFEQDVQSQKMIEQKYRADMNQMKQLISEREHNGAKFSKQDGDAFENWVSTEFPKYINPDGTYNMKMLANFWLGAVKLPAIQKANLSKGASEARMEVLTEVGRPSKNSAVATKLPEPKPVMTDVERATKGIAQHFGGRKV